MKNFSEQTLRKIKWVRKLFWEWRNFRNETTDEMIVFDLEDEESVTVESLVFALCRFLTEVKKVNGEDYPPKTLYEMIICIQFHLETLGFSYKLVSDDDNFKDLKYTLDNIMKERTAAGLGNNKRQAEVVTTVIEDILWEVGVVGLDTPDQLRNAVFMCLGLGCAMRAGKEHHGLKAPGPGVESQFTWKYDDNGVRFIRYTQKLHSKTNQGGLRHRKCKPKIVDIFPIPNSKRDPVMIIEKYLSVLPCNRKHDNLYMHSNKDFLSGPWYLDKPLGINKLQSVVADMCKKAGIPGRFTNHSLRATAATRLYHAQVDEQIIQEITGHKSLAVREYKRTCQSQKRVASEIIHNRKSKVLRSTQ